MLSQKGNVHHCGVASDGIFQMCVGWGLLCKFPDTEAIKHSCTSLDYDNTAEKFSTC